VDDDFVLAYFLTKGLLTTRAPPQPESNKILILFKSLLAHPPFWLYIQPMVIEDSSLVLIFFFGLNKLAAET
jgi:hypothetical protein